MQYTSGLAIHQSMQIMQNIKSTRLVHNASTHIYAYYNCKCI